MFERFTDRARRVIVLAQEEARELGHNYIGTEHILLGLIGADGLAHTVLTGAGIEAHLVREEIDRIVGRGQEDPATHIPFTPRAKKVLEMSLREAVRLENNYIGTEHILLGLIDEGEGVAAQIMTRHGLSLEAARASVFKMIAEAGEPPVEATGTEGGATVESSSMVAFEAAPQPIEHGLVPMCPRCKGAIEEVGAYKTLEIPEDGGSGTINVLFVYCEACGYAFASKILDT